MKYTFISCKSVITNMMMGNFVIIYKKFNIESAPILNRWILSLHYQHIILTTDEFCPKHLPCYCVLYRGGSTVK